MDGDGKPMTGSRVRRMVSLSEPKKGMGKSAASTSSSTGSDVFCAVFPSAIQQAPLAADADQRHVPAVGVGHLETEVASDGGGRRGEGGQDEGQGEASGAGGHRCSGRRSRERACGKEYMVLRRGG
jgi:hypothetical protein